MNLLKKLIQKSVQSAIDSEICKTVDDAVKNTLQPMFEKPPLQWLACGVIESALFCDIAFPINGLVPPQGFPVPPLPVPNQEADEAKNSNDTQIKKLLLSKDDLDEKSNEKSDASNSLKKKLLEKIKKN